MNVSASDIKEIRELTGAGMLDCKKALVENEGAKDKAIDWLRQKGLSKAAKKAGRVAAEGSVSSHIHNDGKIGVLLEVNCETDFVAKNDDFKAFVSTLSSHIAETEACGNTPKWTEGTTILDQKLASDDSITLKDFLTNAVAKIGENIVIRRFSRFDLSGNTGLVHAYIHGEGRIGVLMEVSTASPDAEEAKAFVSDVSMHIAAMGPEYISMDEITTEAKEAEKAVLKAKAIEEGKKPEFLDKILDGQIKKWAAGVCLLEQPFVKNPDLTVAEFSNQTAKKLGGEFSIKRFTRFELGEGIEKKADNFADEVAQMTSN
jgi:elongation factor Ts